MADLFRYLDYRHFLKDFYREQKGKKGSRFSFRTFSRSAGLSPLVRDAEAVARAVAASGGPPRGHCGQGTGSVAVPVGAQTWYACEQP